MALNTKSYSEISKRHDKAVTNWHDRIEIDICSSPNQAKFYGFINNKLKSMSFIPSLKNENGTLIHSDVEKADLLNSNFHKVFKFDNKIELNLRDLSLLLTAEKILKLLMQMLLLHSQTC